MIFSFYRKNNNIAAKVTIKNQMFVYIFAGIFIYNDKVRFFRQYTCTCNKYPCMRFGEDFAGQGLKR